MSFSKNLHVDRAAASDHTFGPMLLAAAPTGDFPKAHTNASSPRRGVPRQRAAAPAFAQAPVAVRSGPTVGEEPGSFEGYRFPLPPPAGGSDAARRLDGEGLWPLVVVGPGGTFVRSADPEAAWWFFQALAIAAVIAIAATL